MYDCIIIGAGVIGCTVARNLSEYNVKVLVLDKEDDVCAGGASRANSGIIHAGFDCEPATYKAKYNVRGNPMFDRLCEELDVPFKRVGSLVCANKDEYDKLKKLYDKAIQNGVVVEIIGRDKILQLEPNISDNIEYALYAKTAGIISPYKFTIACANYSALNGVDFLLSNKVININPVKDSNGNKIIEVVTDKQKLYAKTVVNCAGAGSMAINFKAGAETYENSFARGEYVLIDKSERERINCILFPLPDENGKGILVAPTADGNVIYGPTSIKCSEPDPITTNSGLELVKSSVSKIYMHANFKKIIRVYSGVRVITGKDFIIKKSTKLSGFIFCLGICSPGLSASPAIADKVIKLLGDFLSLAKKDVDKLVKLQKHTIFAALNEQERIDIIEKDPSYGKIVCRCETVTEAEIVHAIHSPIEARTIDAVKRRVRAGMGRCQGGFCTTRVMELISRELNIPFSEIKKGGEDSEIVVSRIKEDK